jgi:hypothetical protein
MLPCGGSAVGFLCGGKEMRYARVVPGRIAGTIAVTCSEAGEKDQTRVSVTYDITSLSQKEPHSSRNSRRHTTNSSKTGAGR